MRLYLSSYRLGDHSEELTALLPQGARVAVVANSMDYVGPEDRARAVRRELDDLEGLGLRAQEVDLRTAELSVLGDYDCLWVRGGNVFELRHVLATSGADRKIVELLESDAVVYAGYSAGPCVIGPSLRGLEQCDDATVVLRHGAEPRYDGLGVLDFRIVPHVDTPDHPESEVLDEVARQYAAAGVEHLTLRDGQALVVDGDQQRVV